MDGFILEIPEMVGIPLSPARKAQAAPSAWPKGTTIVSADSHMLETDCWIDRFPEHLKDQAPRMEFRDGGYHITVAGQEIGKRPGREFDAAALCSAMECNAGLTDIEARLADLDVEGVEKELIFPQRLFSLFILGKMMNRAETFSAYNEHIAGMCALGKGRLYPVMVPNYWDPAQARMSVERCRELGAHCLMIPIKPGDDVNGEPIYYNDAKMDPLWDAVAASGIPVVLPHRRKLPQQRARRRRVRRAGADAGVPPDLGAADVRRRVRPFPEAEGRVRRGRNQLGRVDAARCRHDLQFVSHQDEPATGASA